MSSREKAIKDLEEFIANFKILYRNQEDWKKIYDVLNFLKEQEVIEPVLDGGEFMCGNCNNPVEYNYIAGINIFGQNIYYHKIYHYCPDCGKKVKWGE